MRLKPVDDHKAPDPTTWWGRLYRAWRAITGQTCLHCGGDWVFHSFTLYGRLEECSDCGTLRYVSHHE